MSSDLPLLSTAIHEAGHAVIALVLGEPFNHVTVKPNPARNSRGRIELLRPHLAGAMQRRTLSADDARTQALIVLAGPIAASMLAGNNRVGSDHAHANALATYCVGGDRVAEQLYSWRREAVRLVEQNVDAIRLVAAALMDHDTLTEAAVKLMIASGS